MKVRNWLVSSQITRNMHLHMSFISILAVTISAAKQDRNFLFWQALIWTKTKGIQILFNAVCPTFFTTFNLIRIFLESMEILDENPDLFVQNKWIMNRSRLV